MEIKTQRAREIQTSRIIPPPDKARHRKKANQKLGKGRIAGRRFVSALQTLGKVGAFLLLVVFMLSVFVYAYTSEKFNLRTIRVFGCKELDPKHLEAIVREDFPANILRIDLQQLKNRLEKETWAKNVEIRRVLPSDLMIRVEERTPSVILEMHGELMVADRDGTMLGRYDPRFGKLDVPVFRGALGDDAEAYRLYQEENAARICQALVMLSDIESGLPQYTQKISEVDISDRNNLKILLVDDPAEVCLGEKDYLKRFRKLVNNMSEYRKLKDQYNEIASIDLRFDNQIVYRPRRAVDESLKNKTARLESSKAGNR
jgi:cell division septal protein FtsQ